jgi:hypothetical protein
MAEISELVGQTLANIEVSGEGDYIEFTTIEGVRYAMEHMQDCCENVHIEDINGDLNDLIGSMILLAEERCSDTPEVGESCTWTFYTLATLKGFVTLRWLGESNGYYSEEVNFEKLVQ